MESELLEFHYVDRFRDIIKTLNANHTWTSEDLAEVQMELFLHAVHQHPGRKTKQTT